jgi:hypothetical protein
VSESAPVVSFDRSSPVHAYWLANCEGFRVRAGGRHGVVEEVELGPGGRVSHLVIGFGLGRRTVVPPSVVDTVVPAEEVLVLHVAEREPAPPRLAPVARRSAAVGRSGALVAAHASALAASRTWRASRSGSQAARTGARHASAAARRETGRLARWSGPRIEAAARRIAIAADVGAARLVAVVYALVCSARANGGPAARAIGAAARRAWSGIVARGRELAARRRAAPEPPAERDGDASDEGDRAA